METKEIPGPQLCSSRKQMVRNENNCQRALRKMAHITTEGPLPESAARSDPTVQSANLP